jgi:hypothetical protein
MGRVKAKEINETLQWKRVLLLDRSFTNTNNQPVHERNTNGIDIKGRHATCIIHTEQTVMNETEFIHEEGGRGIEQLY